MAEVSVPPDGGPPPHVHYREEEFFHLFARKTAIQAGGMTLSASRGDFVHLRSGIVH